MPWALKCVNFVACRVANYGSSVFSSRSSHAFAIFQSRMTVSTDTLKASAVSSTLSPPKKRISQEWEAEVSACDAEPARLAQPRPLAATTAQKIIELAKQAEFLYRSQIPTEQRRLLDTVLSNCSFDHGTLLSHLQ